jgi:hypothetical protein
MAITSCANVTCLNLFAFLHTKHKVYKYHITQFTIDTLLSLMSSLRILRVHAAPVGFV